jgi:hypothetical protein
VLNLFRDIFPAARCVLLICFLSTINTPQLAAGIFYFVFSDLIEHAGALTAVKDKARFRARAFGPP